jgi:hypothetical protein
MSPQGRRAQQAVIAQRLRVDGGGGEGLSLSAIAREMGISTSYASSLLSDPTGEADRARKRDHYRRTAAKKRKPPKWTRENIIEAIQEWEILNGKPPTCPEWSRRDGLPEWAPTVGVVFRVFGKHGWNKAMEAAGFTPRPAQFPDWVVQEQSMAPITPMAPDVRARMSEERKALYAENPDHPMFQGLKEGWDITLQRQERRERRFAAKQAARQKCDS